MTEIHIFHNLWPHNERTDGLMKNCFLLSSKFVIELEKFKTLIPWTLTEVNNFIKDQTNHTVYMILDKSV